jgi:hypothetical protein
LGCDGVACVSQVEQVVLRAHGHVPSARVARQGASSAAAAAAAALAGDARLEARLFVPPRHAVKVRRRERGDNMAFG